MADNTQVDQDLLDGIAMLEQILEVMPDDQEALKALYNAYCQAGQRDRAAEYIGKLADVVYSNNDLDAVDFVIEELRSFTEEFPGEVVSRLARLQALNAQKDEGSPTRGKQTGSSSSPEADVGEELTLAWKLYEEGQLSQEEYSAALHDVTEISTKEIDVPSTLLHVLYDRGFPHMNRLINHLSARSGVPCIALRNFEFTPQLATVFPIELVAHDGVLPFGFFGEDLQVAILNPYNGHSLKEAERISKRRCHPYLVHPDDYDTALAKLRELAQYAQE